MCTILVKLFTSYKVHKSDRSVRKNDKKGSSRTYICLFIVISKNTIMKDMMESRVNYTTEELQSCQCHYPLGGFFGVYLLN